MAPEPTAKVVDLMEALKASVAAAKKAGGRRGAGAGEEERREEDPAAAEEARRRRRRRRRPRRPRRRRPRRPARRPSGSEPPGRVRRPPGNRGGPRRRWWSSSRRPSSTSWAPPRTSANTCEWIWHVPYVDLARDTLLVSAGEELAGYGEAIWDPSSPGPMSVGGVVRPSHRGSGIGTAILRRNQEIAGTRGVTGLRHRGVHVADTDRARLPRGERLRARPELLHDGARRCRRTGPPARPDGIEIRPFETGRDERALYENHEATFADHWGFVPESYESFVGEWYESSDWVPELAYLAWAGEEAVGHACRARVRRQGLHRLARGPAGVAGPRHRAGAAASRVRRPRGPWATRGHTGRGRHRAPPARSRCTRSWA